MPKPDAVSDIAAKLKNRQAGDFGIHVAADSLGWLRHLTTKELRGGASPRKLFGEAKKRLTFTSSGMAIVKADEAEEGNKNILGTLNLVISSRKRDRDGDVLEPSGAEPDPKMPLLWQHFWSEPIGALTQITKQNSARIAGEFTVANTALGQDAWMLCEVGALRVSHGFDPIEYEAILEKDDEGYECWTGWHVTRYAILETSLVSVPSNTDAVVTAMSRAKLHHPAVKAWAQALERGRTKSVRVGWDGAAAATPTLIPRVKRGDKITAKLLNGLIEGVNSLRQLNANAQAATATLEEREPTMDEAFRTALGKLATASYDDLVACRRFANAAQDLVDLLHTQHAATSMAADLENLLA